MAFRFPEDAALRRRPMSVGMAILGAVLCVFLLACGASPETPEAEAGTALAEAPADAEYRQHLRDLEVQLESLERQSEAMRREVLSRLDQIDVTREALAVQLQSLRGEVAEPVEAPSAPPVEPAPAEAEAATPAPDSPAAAPPAASDSSPFLRFLLLIFILAAIFFLARIFFDRWGDPEDGERPATVEATTDLGKIRFPPGTEAHPAEGDEGAPGDPADDDEGRPGD